MEKTILIAIKQSLAHTPQELSKEDEEKIKGLMQSYTEGLNSSMSKTISDIMEGRDVTRDQ